MQRHADIEANKAKVRKSSCHYALENETPMYEFQRQR